MNILSLIVLWAVLLIGSVNGTVHAAGHINTAGWSASTNMSPEPMATCYAFDKPITMGALLSNVPWSEATAHCLSFAYVHDRMFVANADWTKVHQYWWTEPAEGICTP